MFKLFASTAPAKTAEVVSEKAEFTAWDWVIMAIYMIAMTGIGVFFFVQEKRNKNKNSQSYLTAQGMKIPAIVIALSIWATALSSLTFLGLPGLAFKTGWMWMVAQLTFLFVAPVLIKWIIPFYRRIKESTAYAYLEKRFSYALRVVGSGSFILFHIFRVAIVLYIPALTLSLFVDMNIYLILVIVAVVVSAGTFLGGFKGVLWTDAIQGFIFLVGIILIVIFGLAKTDWEVAKIQQIFTKDQWKVSAASAGMFFIFIAKYIETLFAYTASQDIVQRYKAGSSVSKVYKSIYINIVLTVITILVFYGVGSMLYSYYSGLGYDVDAKTSIDTIVGIKGAANNQLLSYFIIKVLPVGISGLIIAAIFAASQSTISSSLNSLANAIIVDFVSKLPKKLKDSTLLLISKILILSFGILGLLVSCVLAATGQRNLIEFFLSVVGLLAAPLAALFILGILTTRTNWLGALIGVSIAFIIAFHLWLFSGKIIPANLKIAFHEPYLVIVSFFTTLILGYGFSFLISLFTNKFQTKNIVNMTIWTRTKEFKELVALEKQIAKQEGKSKKKVSAYFADKREDLQVGSNAWLKETNIVSQSEAKLLNDLVNKYEELDKIVDSQTA